MAHHADRNNLVHRPIDLPIEAHFARAKSSIVAAGSDFTIVVNVETADAHVFRASGVDRFTEPFRLPEWNWFYVPVRIEHTPQGDERDVVPIVMPEPPSDELILMAGLTQSNYDWMPAAGGFRKGARRFERAADGTQRIRPHTWELERSGFGQF